jgi:hypothetical protein
MGYGPAASMLPADIASVANAILDDKVNTHPIVPSAWSSDGLLYLPQGRSPGGIRMLPGDVIAVDSRGWPIIVSADAIANGPWHFV